MKTYWPALALGCLWLAGDVIAVHHARAQTAQLTPVSVQPQRATISAVEVAQSGPETTVRISGVVDLRYQSSRLDSPPRLVLDFADTRLDVKRYKVASEFAPVMGVRLGQPVPGQSRVVIDLSGQAHYTVQENGSNITL